MKKTVAFGSITLRSYPITLGDHPSCRSGPPLTIEWDHTNTATTSVDDFENEKSSLRRNANQMVIPETYRLSLVKKGAGMSDEEIKSTLKEVRKVQKQRQSTIALCESVPLEVQEAFAFLNRSLKKAIKRKRRKQEKHLFV